MPSVLDLCAEMPNQKIDSKKFGDILQVDGIPLWYFLDPFYLPKPFKPWSKIDEIVAQGRTPSQLDDFKTSIFSFIQRKELLINEKLKRFISKRKVDKTKLEKRDVLFLSYPAQVFEENGKFDFLGFGDVLKALERKKVKPLVTVCDLFSNPFYKFREYLDAPDYLVTPYEYIDRSIIQESKRLSQELNREWKKIDKSKLFTFRGKNYWEFMKNEMNFIFSRELLFTTLVYHLTFKKIIKAHDVKGVHVTGLGIHELAFLAAARKLGKWAICSPHGYGYFPHGYGTRLYSKYVDIIFPVAGEERRREFVKRGVKSENVVITGSPFFDKIAEYKSKTKAKTGKTVTLLSSAIVEYNFAGKDEYFNYIRRCLSQISKARNVKKMIIKLHPDEKYKSEYESIAKSLKLTNVEIVQKPGKEVLYSILRDSDLLISFGSTTDIEGLMLDKDMIVVEGFFGADYTKDPYKKAVMQVEKEDNLTNIVDKILSYKRAQNELRKKREKYIKSAFYKVDGKSHERVADLIVRLLRK